MLASRETVVDLAAKHALEKSTNRRIAVPYSDFKVLTNMYVKKLWQTEWERYPGNKLYKIQPTQKHTQHAPSTKTECDYLNGWIKKRSHTQKSHPKW